MPFQVVQPLKKDDLAHEPIRRARSKTGHPREMFSTSWGTTRGGDRGPILVLHLLPPVRPLPLRLRFFPCALTRDTKTQKAQAGMSSMGEPRARSRPSVTTLGRDRGLGPFSSFPPRKPPRYRLSGEFGVQAGISSSFSNESSVYKYPITREGTHARGGSGGARVWHCDGVPMISKGGERGCGTAMEPRESPQRSSPRLGNISLGVFAFQSYIFGLVSERRVSSGARPSA